MKGFKDVVRMDVSNVFADTNIFFDGLTVDGKEMRVLLDFDTAAEWKGAPGKDEHLNGLYEDDVTAYIPVDDYGKKPKSGKPIVIDGKQYLIRNCLEEAGMYAFTLRRRRQ